MWTSASPVIIVGNGPVGQTAALLLARWRVPVILLDQRLARDAVGSKAICQQRDVLDIWEAIGAGSKIATQGLTWRTVRTFYKDQQLFAYNLFDGSPSVIPPFVNISQARTEELLDEEIARQPLIDVRWGHRVCHIDQSPDAATVSFETDSGVAAIAGGFVVVCAGARSDALRRDIGMTFNGLSFDDRFLICDIEADLPGWASERRFFLIRSGTPEGRFSSIPVLAAHFASTGRSQAITTSMLNRHQVLWTSASARLSATGRTGSCGRRCTGFTRAWSIACASGGS